MSEVGVYQAPGYQGGFLTPLLLLVVTVFGSHSGGVPTLSAWPTSPLTR